jgi:uncharacterized membrane protein YcjF (UPF0283 family)
MAQGNVSAARAADLRPAGTKLSWRAVREGAAERVRRRQVLWIGIPVAFVVLLVVAAIGGYAFNWRWTGFRGNTLWDWMNLLFTPVAIGVASISFNLQQMRRNLRVSEEQRAEATCEACLDHISHLLVDGHLREAPPESAVRQVARARTLAAVRRVGPQHRALIRQFLDESGLLAGDTPMLTLEELGTGA